MLPRTSSIWQRDSHPTASGKPGAVHSDGKEQFDQVMTAVRASPELVALGKDGRDQERFTSRDMIAVEARPKKWHSLPASLLWLQTCGCPSWPWGHP